jgi:polysaccharide export outer membrane protein
MRKALLATVFCVGIVGAQTRQVPVVENGSNLPAQEIGANDLIAISVYDAPELTRTVRVGADGEFALPMLKRKIHAEGLLPDILEVSVAQALQAEQILVDPVVTITIVEYHSRPISVVGAVHKPVTFQAEGPVTLIDAITRAEGLSTDAGPEILISRTRPGKDGSQSALVERISVKGLIDDANPDLNPRLYGGEQVRVPEVGKVFVVGNVHKPGSFPVQDSSGTTVLKVLAVAEGLMPFAEKVAFIYRQTAGSTTKTEIPIELNKIMDRKTPDVALEANDILYIPDNKGRRMTLTAIDRLAGFGSSTASGVLIWRH